MLPPAPTPIFRIMHLRNLPGVVASGRLFCENQRQSSGQDWKSIAHQNIQGRRHGKQVTCGPGGTVCDYVPWYYAPRSPMLFAHHKGNVPGNTEGQVPLIYFRSSIQRVVEEGLPFVFTDGHAIMEKSKFFDDLSSLGRIDWPLMNARYWKDTDEDPDRCRRRQAEFLVYGSFPFSLVQEIVVFNSEILAEAQKCLQGIAFPPIIRMNKNWYFE